MGMISEVLQASNNAYVYLPALRKLKYFKDINLNIPDSEPSIEKDLDLGVKWDSLSLPIQLGYFINFHDLSMMLSGKKIYGYINTDQVFDWNLIYRNMIFTDKNPARIYLNYENYYFFYFEFTPKGRRILTYLHIISPETVGLNSDEIIDRGSSLCKTSEEKEKITDLLDEYCDTETIQRYKKIPLEKLQWTQNYLFDD
jgi:hypothetical protein